MPFVRQTKEAGKPHGRAVAAAGQRHDLRLTIGRPAI